MTNKERLEFIRAGYSANDIREFERVEAFAHGDDSAEQEQTQATEQEQEQTQATEQEQEQTQEAEQHRVKSAPAWATALQASIDKLTAATQKANVLFDDMGGEADRETKADAALGQYITGKKAGKK